MSHQAAEKGFVALATTCLTFGAVATLALVLTRASPGQIWPDASLPNLQTHCDTTGGSCAACVSGATIGCNSPIPPVWAEGECQQGGPPPEPKSDGCRESFYDCGSQLVCSTGMPNGGECPENFKICLH